MAQSPGPFPQNGEGYEYPEKDVHPGQPEDPHSEKRCSSPESNNSRRTDKGRPVGHRHYVWMHLSPGDHVVSRRCGQAPSPVSQIGNDEEIDDDSEDAPTHFLPHCLNTFGEATAQNCSSICLSSFIHFIISNSSSSSIPLFHIAIP